MTCIRDGVLFWEDPFLTGRQPLPRPVEFEDFVRVHPTVSETTWIHLPMPDGRIVTLMIPHLRYRRVGEEHQPTARIYEARLAADDKGALEALSDLAREAQEEGDYFG